MNLTAAQGRRKIFKFVYKSAQDLVQNVTDKELLSNSLGHYNVIRFNILIRAAEFIILLPNLKKKSSILKWGVQRMEIERTVCKGKVH